MRMFTRNKVAFNVIYLMISANAVVAWLAPERCRQDAFLANEAISNVENTVTVNAVDEITEIALQQNYKLNTTYKNINFFGVPIRGSRTSFDHFEVYMPHDCTFHTHSPSLLSTVYCQDDLTCKLEHTVTTVDTYSASEGYNWGVKLSAKYTFIEKVFEVGGEVSTGGTYSCTYTKSRSKTDKVECAVAAAKGKTLQLFNVRTDMQCEFSEVQMVRESRNGKSIAHASLDLFTVEEQDQIIKALHDGIPVFFPNLDLISQSLMRKLKEVFPDYNPFTDALFIVRLSFRRQISVMYHKVGSVQPGDTKIVPFTNEAGDSVFQYACLKF